MRAPAPLTLVVIKEIIESPVDSRVPTPKKGQTIPTIEGFTLLVLALPTVAEPSPGFIEKGTPIVPTIRGFDPLVLPRSILGISRMPRPKALDIALPSLVVINLKMFSLAPNMQTQEDVIIHKPKPFPYKDSHHVLWNYDMALIFTRIGKEKVCSNISSGLVELTRSNRCYTFEELEKRRKEISKGTLEPVRNRVTTEEAN